MGNTIVIERNMENEKLQIKSEKPGIIAVVSVLAYSLMVLHFFVGLFINISAFAPDVFRSLPAVSAIVFMTQIITSSYLNPVLIFLLVLFPLIGIAGLILTFKEIKTGFWIFSISQLLFLAIPLVMFSPSAHYLTILVTLLPSIIILPILIIFFGRHFYSKKKINKQ
ncbi:MAG: hypothetical protein ACOCWC_04400 [Bacteroidota bacterium]